MGQGYDIFFLSTILRGESSVVIEKRSVRTKMGGGGYNRESMTWHFMVTIEKFNETCTCAGDNAHHLLHGTGISLPRSENVMHLYN